MPFSKDKHVPYSSIKDKLNTGDIVLFSSVCSAGFAIKVIGVQQFTHAALVSIIHKPQNYLHELYAGSQTKRL